MTLTFRVCTHVKDIGLKKCYLLDIFVLKVKRLKLNFSMEKSKFAPIMLLYRFSYSSSWYLYVPNILRISQKFVCIS